MKPHILGAILMRLEVMSAGEFNAWLKGEGYAPEEIDQIRADVISQRKEAKISYGKVY